MDMVTVIITLFWLPKLLCACDYFHFDTISMGYNALTSSIMVGETLEMSFQLQLDLQCSSANYCHLLKIGNNSNYPRLPLIYALVSGEIEVVFSTDDERNDKYRTSIINEMYDGNYHTFYFKWSTTERLFIFDGITKYNITNGAYISSTYIDSQYVLQIFDSFSPGYTNGTIKNLCINSSWYTDSPTRYPTTIPTKIPTEIPTHIPTNHPVENTDHEYEITLEIDDANELSNEELDNIITLIASADENILHVEIISVTDDKITLIVKSNVELASDVIDTQITNDLDDTYPDIKVEVKKKNDTNNDTNNDTILIMLIIIGVLILMIIVLILYAYRYRIKRKSESKDVINNMENDKEDIDANVEMITSETPITKTNVYEIDTIGNKEDNEFDKDEELYQETTDIVTPTDGKHEEHVDTRETPNTDIQETLTTEEHVDNL
eukprot:137701_1